MNSLLLLLACGVVGSFAVTCDQAALKRCEDMKPFDEVSEYFPHDPAKLDAQCDRVRPAIECYVEVLESCPDLFSKSQTKYVLGAETLINRVCVESGPFRDNYLKHAKCLNEVFYPKLVECKALAKSVIPEGTCAYFLIVGSCTKLGVEEKCGSEAKRVFREVWDDVVKPTLEKGACDKS